MTELTTKLEKCRICKSSNFESILNFGQISLTGVFIYDGTKVPKAALELVRCDECGLAQLNHSYNQDTLYGESYGYESNLNSSMREHLTSKARLLESKYLLNADDSIVVDIASNDGTLLSGYKNPNSQFVGIDPLINSLNDFYPTNTIKIAGFFSDSLYNEFFTKKATLVTSLSVIYDLEDPMKFAKDVSSILENDGIWHFEQSYLPTMVATNSFDTICHEHLLYLTLKDIKTILDSSGFQIISVSLNDINGGSIAITAKKTSTQLPKDPFLAFLLENERELGYEDSTALINFSAKIMKYKSQLATLINNYKDKGFEIVALGASTKGNVLLQFCSFNDEILKLVGDINPKKYGKRTPGTNIKIVSEDQVLATAHDKMIAIVLPWHFRKGIIEKSQKFLALGGRLLFPLPNIEVISN